MVQGCGSRCEAVAEATKSLLLSEESNFKAIKIQKSAQHYREAAYDEITLLTQIREGDSMSLTCPNAPTFGNCDH